MTEPTRIRTTISVDKEVHQIFVQMAESAGMSVSRCMGEWLADTADGAMLVAQKMKEARQAPKIVMREMQAMAAGLSADVNETILAIRAKSAQSDGHASRPSSEQSSLPKAAPSSLTGLKSPKKGKK